MTNTSMAISRIQGRKVGGSEGPKVGGSEGQAAGGSEGQAAGGPVGRMRIGAHMSVAGGVSRAVARAKLHGCEALQIFTKNASQWRGQPLLPEAIAAFRRQLEESGIAPTVSHASYLINL